MATLTPRLSLKAVVANTLPRRIARFAIGAIRWHTLGARKPSESLGALASTGGRTEAMLARVKVATRVGAACAARMIVAVEGGAIPIRIRDLCCVRRLRWL